MEIMDSMPIGKKTHTIDVKLNTEELEIFNSGRFSFKILINTDNPESDNYKSADPGEITDAIINYFGYDIETIKIRGRKRKKVDARMYVSYYLRRYTRLNLASIGLILNRDHATVLHALKRFKNEILYDDTKVVKTELDLLLTSKNII